MEPSYLKESLRGFEPYRPGQQPQCPGKRQYAEDKTQGEQVEGRLHGKAPLRRRQ